MYLCAILTFLNSSVDMLSYSRDGTFHRYLLNIFSTFGTTFAMPEVYHLFYVGNLMNSPFANSLLI